MQLVASVLGINVGVNLVCMVQELVYVEPRHCDSIFPRAILRLAKYHHDLEFGNVVLILQFTGTLLKSIM